jgi:hypothetical protein
MNIIVTRAREKRESFEPKRIISFVALEFMENITKFPFPQYQAFFEFLQVAEEKSVFL